MTEPAQPSPSTLPRRSRRGCWIAAILFVLVLMAGAAVTVFLFLAGLAGSMQGVAPKIARGSVLELRLSGPMTESPPIMDLGIFGFDMPPSLWELRRALESAADDDRVAGLLLQVHGPAIGWASAEEIVAQLDRFRDSGKPVYATVQSDMLDDLTYYLATGGDRIWLNPQTAGVVNGLVAESPFVRGTLDKLHVEPEVIMYKEYKSAGEMFANYEMSPYMREALEAVLQSMDGAFRSRVMDRRGVTAAALDELMARGMTSGEQLVEAGLVDELGYVDQVESAFEDADAVEEYEGVTVAKYLRSLGSTRAVSGDRIAVVFGEGQIVAESLAPSLPFFGTVMFSGPAVAKNLREAAEDPRVKAIVFRINSPGGSAVGSDVVLREVIRARESGKPVVASMSDVAGSGGYWVAMAADRIVARPTTITGSIGVVFSKLGLEGFFEWIGTNFDQVSTAPRADIFGIGPWGEGDREAVLSWMDAVYGNFTRAVAEHRGLELAAVQEVAKGRIWSGTDALGRRLIDRLGGLDEAVSMAKEAAGIDAEQDVPLVVYPAPKTLWQRILEDDWTSAETVAHALRTRLAEVLAGQTQPRVEALAPAVRAR
ncbi:MAG TPA: signal peptide peptidase SppA [Thermoanaerobaculia bacterium]|nr:signal peptide peptidase SppA [Thermoanaerobaculia bacterium]